MDEILASLQSRLEGQGQRMDDRAIRVLTTPRRTWTADEIGIFRSHIAPNWLTLRRVLREAMKESDARAWMDAVEGAPTGEDVPLVRLAGEALYNNPHWPDGTPRRDHRSLDLAAMAVYFISIAGCFYSIILGRPLWILAMIAFFLLLQVPLQAFRRILQDRDWHEYQRERLV